MDLLLHDLEASAVLLESLGGAGVDHLQRAHRLVASRDAYGLELTVSCLGGMGSFGDLRIHPGHGHDVERGDVDKVNEQLEANDVQPRTDAVAGVVHQAAHPSEIRPEPVDERGDRASLGSRLDPVIDEADPESPGDERASHGTAGLHPDDRRGVARREGRRDSRTSDHQEQGIPPGWSEVGMT
jgi:hypothetical protein